MHMNECTSSLPLIPNGRAAIWALVSATSVFEVTISTIAFIIIFSLYNPWFASHTFSGIQGYLILTMPATFAIAGMIAFSISSLLWYFEHKAAKRNSLNPPVNTQPSSLTNSDMGIVTIQKNISLPPLIGHHKNIDVQDTALDISLNQNSSEGSSDETVTAQADNDRNTDLHETNKILNNGFSESSPETPSSSDSSSHEGTLESRIVIQITPPPTEQIVAVVSEPSLSTEDAPPLTFPYEAFETFLNAFLTVTEIEDEMPIEIEEEKLQQLNKKETTLSSNSSALVDTVCQKFYHITNSPEFKWILSVRDANKALYKPREALSSNKPVEKTPQESKSETDADSLLALIVDKSSRDKIKDHKIIAEGRSKLLEVFETHWEECAEGYPLESIENNLAIIAQFTYKQLSAEEALQLHFAWFSLLPFFIRFYNKLGNDRTEVFAWIKNLQLSSSNPSIQFVYNFALEYVIPIIPLFSEDDYPGKQFLGNFIKHFLFRMMPPILEYILKKDLENLQKSLKPVEEMKQKYDELKQLVDSLQDNAAPSSNELDILPQFQEALTQWEQKIQKREKYLYLNLIETQTLLFEFAPFMAKLTEALYGENKEEEEPLEISSYIERLQEIQSAFLKDGISPQNLKTVTKKVKELISSSSSSNWNKEIVSLKSTLDDLQAKYKALYKKTNEKDLPEFYKTSSYQKSFARLHEDSSSILNTLHDYLCSIFGDSISSFGDYQVKSLLISQQIPNIYKTPEDKLKFLEEILSLLIETLKLGGIDTKELEQYKSQLTSLMTTLASHELASQSNEIFKIIPIHDIGLLFLTITFAIKHLDKLRPFLAEHNDAIINFLVEMQVEEILKNEATIRRFVGLILGLLAPFNELFLGKAFPKYWALEATISVMFKGIEKALKTAKKQKLKKDGQYPLPNDNQLLNNGEKGMLAITKPIIKFVVLGYLGNSWLFGKCKEAKALEQFENKFSQFYKDLYNFDLNQMAQNPETLQEHIQKNLAKLMNK